MTFRRDIAEYCELHNIPKAVDYERLGPQAISEYRQFEAQRVSKFRPGKIWNEDLYKYEMEFMYHFRNLTTRELVDKLMEIHFSKRFKTITKPQP